MRFSFPPSFDLAQKSRELLHDEETRMMLRVIEDLHLKNRSLVSDDFRVSLEYIAKIFPMEILEVPSGTEVWTWTVPKKWSVREAWLKEGGYLVCDFRGNPLHLASYSIPFSGRVTREELLLHLNFDPDRRAAIPYAYHYYRPDWSFSISYDQFLCLGNGPFEVHIDTAFNDDSLTLGEAVLPGENEDSIVLCSHLCHPGQVNDGLSGVAVGLALMKRLSDNPQRRFTYRLVLCPENIGSLCYLFIRQSNIKQMKYGIILEMLGNKNHMKLQYSRQGNTEIDRLAEYVLANKVPSYGVGAFRKVICNDEINLNGPGIDIPTISISRWPYPEYHTSDDNPSIISPRYMKDSVGVVWNILQHLEKNIFPNAIYKGNLFLSRYGLYENLNTDDTIEQVLLAFDGRRSVLEIAEMLDISLERVEDYVDRFFKEGLITKERHPR